MDRAQEVIAFQRAAWDKFSPGWETWNEFIVQWIAPVTDSMIDAANVEPGDRVLDAACGSGEPGITLAARMPECSVIGTDVSEEMARVANKIAKDRDLENYEAQAAPTSSLPFEDDSFDAALCRFGVMFSPNPVDDVRELARVVKPDGRIVIGTWNGPQANPWTTIVPMNARPHIEFPVPGEGAPGIFRFADKETLRALLVDAGLDQVEVEEIKGEMEFDAPEMYWDFINETTPPIAMAISQADPETREKVRSAVLEVLENNHARNGNIVCSWSAWVGYGSAA